MQNESVLRSSKTGLPPGSPIYIGSKNAEETRISLRCYDSEKIVTFKSVSVEDCVNNKDKFKVMWIDVVGLRDIEKIISLCENFGLHPLSVEDIFNTQQRPKVDAYEDYIFLTMRAYAQSSLSCNLAEDEPSNADYNYVFESPAQSLKKAPLIRRKTYRKDRECKRINSQQISFILEKNLVITIRESSSEIFDAVKNRLQAPQNVVRKKSADYLIYTLIDVIVDGYFNIVEVIGDKIETLEEKVTGNPDAKIIKEIHAAKREMIYLRKAIWPLREVISGLQHRPDGLLDNETIFYLKDVYDHTIQIIDTVETYRDFLASMLEVYLTSISNKLNEVMKVLTVFASIFIPLTFVTSLYGMNFDTSSPFNMPELHWHYGYLFVWGIMLALTVLMLIFFKRKKWW